MTGALGQLVKGGSDAGPRKPLVLADNALMLELWLDETVNLLGCN